MHALPQPSLYFEKKTVQDGLSHNKVNCILQDQRGFVWLGTDDGLNRYDGKRFVHFRSRPNDTASVSGNIITDLLEDKDGMLWIATADGGLTSYDHRKSPARQFRQFKHVPGLESSLPVNAIHSIVEDQFGYLWLGTGGRSVLRFHKSTGIWDDITGTTKTILDLSFDNKGLIWVGAQGGGIMKIDPKNLKTETDERYKHLYARLPHVTVTSLFRDKAGHMWFGSWDQYVYRKKNFSETAEVFSDSGPFSFSDDEILSFAQDASGRIWMGGKEKGLHIYDTDTKRFFNYRHDPSKVGTVAGDRINCIYIDREEHIWIGTNNGISINNPEKQQFNQEFLLPSGLHQLVIYDMYEQDNGELWIGTSKGIFIRQRQGEFRFLPVRFKGKDLQVTCFYRDVDGRFYVGTDYTLFLYNRATGNISMLPNTEKDSVMHHIIESRVVSVIRDTIMGSPVLLTSPYGHFLTYYDLNNRKWISRFDSLDIIRKFNLKDNLIRRFYRTSKGQLWMASFKTGLVKWTHHSIPRASFLEHDPFDAGTISGNNVFDIREDKRGNLWVSLYGGGLNYYSTTTGQFTSITGSSNLVEGIETDHRGHVWMVSNGQLHRYDPVKRSYESYALPDLENTGGVKGYIFKDSRNRLYVSGNNYIISFHPDSIQSKKKLPSVYFTDFQIFNRSYRHLLQQKEIRLHHRDNYFAFEFAAPDFSSGSEVSYSYMLEGFDENWIEAGERTYVSYPNLEGGRYVFKVRATNTPGTWSNYASVPITIIPPYWKQAWFYMATALFLVLAIYAIYRYHINEIIKRQGIRNRIAQDLHDNVGSTLSSISVYSQVAKIYHHQQKQHELFGTLEKISATSSEMISELNDTVWAINPRNDNMGVIFQRMESFAKPLLAAQQIRFRLDYDKQLVSLNLDMEIRKNFYLIFKEAVNNAIKYAECTLLDVLISQKGNRICMTISDNGKGFDLSSTSEGYKSSDVYGGGNGLKNMQRRASEMKGLLTMRSQPGKGTSIELVFPIT